MTLERMHSGAPFLFPRVQRREGKKQIWMPFLPYYTLGELFVQGRADLLGTMNLLRDVFDGLGWQFYRHRCDDHGETYLNKVERRLKELFARSGYAVEYEACTT